MPSAAPEPPGRRAAPELPGKRAAHEPLIPDPALVARFHAALTALHPFASAERLGLAVSGGPDSLALLLLAAAAFPGRIEAATVDHGLRPAGADEARMVAALCARLDVPHATLSGVWNSDAPEGLQAAARAYRYRQLAGWCVDRGLALLATGHHADDQAETLLMRLARGAGVGGLGAIRAARPLAADDGRALPILLVRPLLRVPRRALGEVVAAAGLVAADDPSNASDRFDRTRARRLLATTDWLDPARLAAAASHLADAEAALAWAADLAFANHATLARGAADGAEWLVDPAHLPAEMLRRVVARVLALVEGEAQAGACAMPPTGPDLTRLIDRLAGGAPATLGHVLARPGARWRFAMAPPRRGGVPG
ncbi:tRNA lysidine(34) synthetase TilS [Sphingomonas profundi]|uniref:tRNA lysidine(34) synthetase TilS n=1 Tax=Alterirhizorhabdus profundi TaxID=2681549 RepID=UPI0012E7E7FE|nr:tRNA lysidine(34) synthetase TilS [Sphingomonas profundi]